MKTLHNSKITSFFILVLIFVSCINHDDVYQGTKQEQKYAKSGFEYEKLFSNYRDIQFNITSEYKNGRFYAIYTYNPYNENGEDKEINVLPILSGCTPINQKISIPTCLEKIYVLNDAGVKEYSVSELSDATLNINDNNSRSSISRSDIPDEKLNEIKLDVLNHILPEKCHNVRGEELYKCTDLNIGELTEGQNVSVWITPLLLGESGGKMWYYTYTKENPSAGDCTFYGKKNGIIEKISINDIKSGKNCIVSARDDASGKEIEISCETLTSGAKIGFVYSYDLGPHFSTPSLNIMENGSYSENDGEIIGQSYEITPGNNFKIEKNVTGGIILPYTPLGSEYSILGFERRLPNQKSSPFDGDFNDMLFLIRCNPETIKPLEELKTSEPLFQLAKEGIWIFEDNYPDEGDFDFNDVVVAYSIVTEGALMKITCKILATGCSFKNEIGLMTFSNTKEADAWKNPTQKIKLWEGVSGFYNVYSDKELDFTTERYPIKTEQFYFEDINLLRPYLKNVNSDSIISTFTYNTGDFPYALDIPSYISNSATPKNTYFCWPVEGISLDNGYWFKSNPTGGERTKSWYQNSSAKDKTKLINRTADMNIW